MGKMKLGYWDIRGRVEAIRYALEYAGAEYEEKLYTMGADPPHDRKEWILDKEVLRKQGLIFSNLPYLFDGNVKMTESMAILKYVCSKYGMMPKDDDQSRATAYNLEGVMIGFTNTFYGEFFVPPEQYEEALKTFREKTFPEFVGGAIKIMGDKKWLLSNEITYLDFQFYSLLKKICCLNENCLQPFPRLKKYVGDFEAIPSIKKYLASGRFRKYPITAPVARWGSREECRSRK
uniref:glutathione S-transferase Mu 4-like n=1 Tax=Styela clava TaxID=7725 RepID=UPI001939C80C|nr:glutathione S-transferase Mu 4-like [Styela clava]